MLGHKGSKESDWEASDSIRILCCCSTYELGVYSLKVVIKGPPHCPQAFTDEPSIVKQSFLFPFNDASFLFVWRLLCLSINHRDNPLNMSELTFVFLSFLTVNFMLHFHGQLREIVFVSYCLRSRSPVLQRTLCILKFWTDW